MRMDMVTLNAYREAASQNQKHASDWTTQHELMAIIADRLEYQRDLIMRAHFKPPYPKVEPLPRPGTDNQPQKQKPRRMTDQERAERMQRAPKVLSG